MVTENQTEDNFDAYEEIDQENDSLNAEPFLEQDISNDFDEVLQLTEYSGTEELRSSNAYVQAEYESINIVEVNNNHSKIAKSIVQKITKFILDFNDVQLTDEHKSYLKAVANLQLNQLTDLLSLTAINKQMLDNMVRRVNAVQAEDYAMLAVYNTLANQHLKFHKELQNTYKNIPTLLRKMRLDVMDTENLLESKNDDIVTEDSGVLLFNNTKQLLKTMKEKQALKNNNSQQNT